MRYEIATDRRRGPYYGQPRRQVVLNMPETMLAKLDALATQHKRSRTQQLFSLIEIAFNQIDKRSKQ